MPLKNGIIFTFYIYTLLAYLEKRAYYFVFFILLFIINFFRNILWKILSHFKQKWPELPFYCLLSKLYFYDTTISNNLIQPFIMLWTLLEHICIPKEWLHPMEPLVSSWHDSFCNYYHISYCRLLNLLAKWWRLETLEFRER